MKPLGELMKGHTSEISQILNNYNDGKGIYRYYLINALYKAQDSITRAILYVELDEYIKALDISIHLPTPVNAYLLYWILTRMDHHLGYEYFAYHNGKVGGKYLYDLIYPKSKVYYEYINITGIPLCLNDMKLPTSIASAWDFWKMHSIHKASYVAGYIELLKKVDKICPCSPEETIRILQTMDILRIFQKESSLYEFFIDSADYPGYLHYIFLQSAFLRRRFPNFRTNFYSNLTEFFKKANLWIIGEDINPCEIYRMAKDYGLLGLYDLAFILEKLVNNKAFINFSGKLRICQGFIRWDRVLNLVERRDLILRLASHTTFPVIETRIPKEELENYSVGLREVPLRETYLDTETALVGLAYILVFGLLRNNGYSFAVGEVRKFLEYLHKLKGTKNIKDAVRQDISRIRRVIESRRINDEIKIDIEMCDGRNALNAHNFETAARYGFVLCEPEKDEPSWRKAYKDIFINEAKRLREKILKEVLKDT